VKTARKEQIVTTCPVALSINQSHYRPHMKHTACRQDRMCIWYYTYNIWIEMWIVCYSLYKWVVTNT